MHQQARPGRERLRREVIAAVALVRYNACGGIYPWQVYSAKSAAQWRRGLSA
jgi:hypothetical protein